MNDENQYDVFISYRREGGYDTAQLLYDRLTQMHYRVSFDLETLRGGKFNKQLYQRIEQCSDVLVIMSKDSLNLREDPDDDWFRLEIAHALKHKKNIVPVFLRDFKFPQRGELPPDIADLVDYQGVTASQEHFDSVLKRICRNFRAKPQRRKWPIALAAIATLLIASGVIMWKNASNVFGYPVTVEQRRQVELLSGNVGLLCTAYNNFLDAENEFFKGARRSVEAGSKDEFEKAETRFLRNVRIAKSQFAKAAKAVSSQIESRRDMPLDYAGIPIFLEATSQQMDGIDVVAANIGFICDPRFPCNKADRLRAVELELEGVALERQSFECSIMGIFSEIKQSSLSELRKVVAELPELPGLSGEWMTDEKVIEQTGTAIANRLQKNVMDRATILGERTKSLAEDEETFKQRMRDAGASEADAERMLGKIKGLAEMKTRLADTEAALAEARDRLREKFAPKDEDDLGMLWGKALRFMKVNMPDEAKRCVDMMRKRNAAEFPPAALDTAEAVFFSNGSLPFTNGLIVCSYMPPATSHAIYKIGDVITAMDGRECRRFEDYRGKTGSRYTIYRRSADGKFEKIEATMPDNQPRVAVANLTED